MWYEGDIQKFEDVNEETVLFFMENEHLKKTLQALMIVNYC